MESFQRLHNSRKRSRKEFLEANADRKEILLENLIKNKDKFNELKETYPEEFEAFIEWLLKQDINDLNQSIREERWALRRKDITDRGNILGKIDSLEDRITYINYYLQSLQEGNPEPIEA